MSKFNIKDRVLRQRHEKNRAQSLGRREAAPLSFLGAQGTVSHTHFNVIWNENGSVAEAVVHCLMSLQLQLEFKEVLSLRFARRTSEIARLKESTTAVVGATLAFHHDGRANTSALHEKT